MSIIKQLRFSIRTFLGNHPSLFFPIYGLKKHNRDLFINEDTEMVISAYPRTANTYFYVALTEVQNRKLNIAHHLHVPALTLEGLKRNIPTVILIRNPKDSIVSLIIREPHITVSQGLKSYLDFYKPVLKHKEELYIADFETITTDFASIIAGINDKFDLNLDNYTDENPLNKEEIFEKIEAINKSFNENKLVENMVSRPSGERGEKKLELIKALESDKYKRQLNECQALYEKIIKN